MENQELLDLQINQIGYSIAEIILIILLIFYPKTNDKKQDLIGKILVWLFLIGITIFEYP